MSDIFISYSKSDRNRARTLAEALEKKGWSVWWDRKIPPGKSFDQVIEEALNETKCVVVLWSKESVNSNWVKEEASEGLRRNILVPALIDDVAIPLGFKRFQAANLVDWIGTSQHTEFDEMVGAIEGIVGKPKIAETDKVSESKEETHQKAAKRKGEVEPKISLKTTEIPIGTTKRQPQKEKLMEGQNTKQSDFIINFPEFLNLKFLLAISSWIKRSIKWSIKLGILGTVYVFLFAYANFDGLARALPFALFVGGVGGFVMGIISGAPSWRTIISIILGIVIASIVVWFDDSHKDYFWLAIGGFGWVFGAIPGALLGLLFEKLRKHKQLT